LTSQIQKDLVFHFTDCFLKFPQCSNCPKGRNSFQTGIKASDRKLKSKLVGSNPQPCQQFFIRDCKRKQQDNFNLTFLGEIFQILTQTINGWPDPSHKKLTRPTLGKKFLTRTHHYYKSMQWKISFKPIFCRWVTHKSVSSRDGPRPARYKRLTRLWPGYFFDSTRWDFFDPKGKKLKNLGFLEEIFQT